MDLRIITTLKEIPTADWQRLTAGSSFPFHDYEYLRALEDSGAVGPDKGWQPLTSRPGALEMKLKTSSRPRSFCTPAWTATENISLTGAGPTPLTAPGITYYPKLTSAIPFNAGDRPKLIGDEGAFAALLKFSRQLEDSFAASSSHHLFIPPNELEFFAREGFAIRHTFQYHWRNDGYADFSEFLAKLKRKRRKDIRQERESLGRAGLRIERLTAAQLTPAIAQQMHSFYLSTIEKMGGIPYLNQAFFKQVFANMQDRIVVFFAYEAGNETPIAGTLNFFKGETLFGRYWGAFQEIKHLHFELCYYQTIDFAIERGLQLFEAGAQGEHKFNRGFLPARTYSAHHITDQRLAHAIEASIEVEKLKITRLFQDYAEHTPFDEKVPGTL